MDKKIRVSKVLKEFNIGLGTLVEFLNSKKIEIESSPGAQISSTEYDLIAKEFGKEVILKEESKKITIRIEDTSKKIVDSAEEERKAEEESAAKEAELAAAKAKEEEEMKRLQEQREQEEKEQRERVEKEAREREAKEKELKEQEERERAEKAKKEAEQKKQKESKAKKERAEKEAKERELKEQLEKQTKERTKKVKREDKAQESKEQVEKESAATKVSEPADKVEETKERTHIETKFKVLSGPTIKGKIDPSLLETGKSGGKRASKGGVKGKRERIQKPLKERVDISKERRAEVGKAARKERPTKRGEQRGKLRTVVDEDAVQKQIKETYLRMVEGKTRARSARYRKDKRDQASQRRIEHLEQQEIAETILKVTEFVTVNDLAVMMDVSVNRVIEACMNLGLMVAINQRLDAEAISLVAEEFGFTVKFITAEIEGTIEDEVDSEDQLIKRPPIVTVMGHVDHGKTSLLDYIREASVIAGEAGGITQHIGAYNVKLDSGEKITFLDTPGHEAFTAMRARGAKITDIAIIIIAADDAVMPQTKEAINHALAAGVPMIFAINKIDKPTANSEKIKEQLASMNILVEDWGGKYQCQEISAKKGINVDALLEKILLEAELLDLKANPDRMAKGSIIESSLDKGRGYVATLLVETGTLKVGDVILSGFCTGRVKAMFNERGQSITEAGPSTPVSILGLNGAPAAGELFNVLEDEREARDIANKREQLIRVQGIKTQKHITLEEIGRRIAIGNFQELNIIVKGDVDGSIEALSDSLIKLSTEEIQVNVIHKAVGAISESDVLLAAASNAIIIGFQVRPSVNARKLAENEEIEIRLYSIIYDAIEEVKDGIEGMLAPEQKEEIMASAEVREIFKISRIGTIAGCMVKEGKLNRNNKVRVIRDGIVIYTGVLESLKRFKEDVREVAAGYDCGLNIENFNDIKVDDIIESFAIVEIKRKL